jgi:hypothetical protein
MARCGTSTQYRNGCRCSKCKAWNAAYSREVRARDAQARTRRAKPKVVALPTTEIPVATIGMGRCERAVRDECDMLERAEYRPSIVAAAIIVAQRMDDPKCFAMAAALAKQLQALMSELQVPNKKKSGARLALVQNMVARR